MANSRFKTGYQKVLSDFVLEVWVVCPTCSKQARVVSPSCPVQIHDFDKVKLTCLHCGHSKLLSEMPTAVLSPSRTNPIVGRYFILGSEVDPYFHIPLWLKAPCCNTVLWAYNTEHLAFIENIIAAKLRERNTTSPKNQSLASRLPQWMTAAKNRDEVLKVIGKLKGNIV